MSKTWRPFIFFNILCFKLFVIVNFRGFSRKNLWNLIVEFRTQ